MSPPYCEVALPVPLRSTFAYAVPPALQLAAQVGSRVLVPFRNRALVGVVLALGDDRPKAASYQPATPGRLQDWNTGSRKPLSKRRGKPYRTRRAAR